MALSQQIFSTTINIAGCMDCNLTNCPPSSWCSPLPSPPATTTIPYSPPENDSTKQSLSPIVIIVVGVLASLFLLVSYYAIIVKYCSSWDLARRPRRGNNDGTHDEIEENLNPLNQFWYVRTVGLDESIINSITVCKYKKDEGLIDGTECTVCLNEFREDEDLRLLPKCSHAFHLPCIDTWLNSHVNCPLCRASIVSNPPNSTSSLDQTVSDRVEAEPENNLGLGNDRTEDLASATDVVADVNGERDVNLFETGKSSSPKEKSPFRVVSDLERNYGSHETVVDMIDEIQPVRRSFSMDDSSSTISSALANLHRTCSIGSSTDQESAIGKSPLDHKKFNFGEFSGLKAIILKHSGNPIKSKQWGTVLGEPSQLMEPIAVKRSFSSSSKFFLSGYSRSRNSILPL